MFITIIVSGGSQSTNKANYFFTSGKLFFIFLMMGVALQNFETKSTSHIFEPTLGVEGIFEGAMITFFGYVGFDV